MKIKVHELGLRSQVPKQERLGKGSQTWALTYALFLNLFIVFANHWRNVIRTRPPFSIIPPAWFICVPRGVWLSLLKRDPSPFGISRSHLGSFFEV